MSLFHRSMIPVICLVLQLQTYLSLRVAATEPHTECPVRIVSNRIQQSFRTAVLDLSSSSSNEYESESVEKRRFLRHEPLGSITEIEAGEEALMSTGGGQFAPPPGQNNTGMLNSEYYSPLEFSNFRCQFIFLAAADERVQLIFQRFHLYESERAGSKSAKYSNESSDIDDTRCKEEDHVTAYVLVGSRMSKIHDFCGSDHIPPQLMSTKNLITLNYIVRSIGRRHRMSPSRDYDYGFLLEYRFITDYGEQPKEAIINSNETCSFTFDGRAQTSGDLWSPNYPGFYPRNVECSYVFHGVVGQIILISFEYFDVEGFGQCDLSTHSDYVLFSNYKTMDRTNRRYCGALRPPKTAIRVYKSTLGTRLVDSGELRMQFSSNDIFDGTGFWAHYQFFDVQSSQKNRVKLSTGSSGHHVIVNLVALVLFTALSSLLMFQQ